MGNQWVAASSWQHAHSCILSPAVFWQNIKSPRWLIFPYSQDLVPCDFWIGPKLKSPLKGKRFHTIDEIQENMMGQLMVTGRTVWVPKVPTLKGAKASLSHVQCFLYLVSSSINISHFHIHGCIFSGQTLCLCVHLCVCFCFSSESKHGFNILGGLAGVKERKGRNLKKYIHLSNITHKWIILLNHSSYKYIDFTVFF